MFAFLLLHTPFYPFWRLKWRKEKTNILLLSIEARNIAKLRRSANEFYAKVLETWQRSSLFSRRNTGRSEEDPFFKIFVIFQVLGLVRYFIVFYPFQDAMEFSHWCIFASYIIEGICNLLPKLVFCYPVRCRSFRAQQYLVIVNGLDKV